MLRNSIHWRKSTELTASGLAISMLTPPDVIKSRNGHYTLPQRDSSSTASNPSPLGSGRDPGSAVRVARHDANGVEELYQLAKALQQLGWILHRGIEAAPAELGINAA
jgi:hypothetical protein